MAKAGRMALSLFLPFFSSVSFPVSVLPLFFFFLSFCLFFFLLQKKERDREEEKEIEIERGEKKE